MSRRYGRNQKRRARAEIAKMELELVNLRTDMALDRTQLQSLRQEIEERDEQLKFVAQVLGTNFIGLRPALYAFENKHAPDEFRWAVDGGDVRIHTMRANITVARDRPDYMVHFRATLMDEVVGYSVSECALRDAPEGYIVRRISDEMARLLMGELRKKFGAAVR